ncbi:short-chain dehydrogenase [Corynespora cassiicola Philippines]|uniref:Short-chain dehydrogenase n=1 Tax=Corynespora cassiicola Philippines TaxID=1448308 RepID=A0A2T2NAJ8_CORCC|nr:short-chain dehydrogenase [Corynespora cassiicola Philippines]
MSRLAPYAEQHKKIAGPGDSRPTAAQIIKDQGLEGKWAGKVVLVTGCSPGGIGPETARAIHLTGADVYITGRDLKKTEEAARDILSDGRPGKVEVIKIDLGSLESIREGVKDFLSKSNKLNILINNAGVMACPKYSTKDGFEMQIGTNHIGHFLLFELLKPTLLASSTPEFNSRVISLSSGGHRLGTVEVDDLNYANRDYDPWVSYGQSKLANIYFANELERRYGSKGLHALSVHPGVIETNLSQHIDATDIIKSLKPIMKNHQQGAATTVWAAVAKEWEGKGGKYLEDCSEAAPAPTPELHSGGYSDIAYNAPVEKALWTKSLELVGLPDDE